MSKLPKPRTVRLQTSSRLLHNEDVVAAHDFVTPRINRKKKGSENAAKTK